jgi:putative ABC transport system permease protein
VTVLDRKRNRDLLRTKGMLLAVAAIVAVGTGSFICMLGTYYNLFNAKESYYAECRMADFWINLKKAPVTAVEPLRTLPGVSDLRNRITFPAIVDLPDVPQPINALVVSMPSEAKPVLNNIVLRQGSYFTEYRRNEAIVSTKFAQARNLHPGDTVNLIMDGQEKEVFIVGTAISAEFVYVAAPGSICDDPENYGIFFLKRDFVEDVFGFHGACNNIVGLLTPEARAEGGDAVIKALAHDLRDYGVFVTIPRRNQFSNLTLTAEMGGLQTMATMLPVLFLGVAALVLNVLMTRIAQQQRTIVGTFKALGYDNREIFWHFIQFGVIVGIIGAIGGCFLGYYLADYMTTMYQGVFEFPDLRNVVYPGLMATALIISIVFAILGTVHGVRMVADLNPAEAMRMPAPPEGGAVILERFPFFWNRLDFRWQMILRGLLRNKIRTLISIAAAALGASMVVVAFGLLNSMDMMINFQFNKIMKSDYIINVKDDVDKGALREARLWPGVLHAEAVLDVPCTFESLNHAKRGAITGLEPGAVLTLPHDKDGTAVRVPPCGLLMTERMAAHLQVREGDTVTFTPVRGNREPHQVEVVKIIRSMLGMTVYADYNYLNSLLGETEAVTSLQLKTAFSADEKAAFYQTLKRCPKLQSVSSIAHQHAIITQQFSNSMLGMVFMMVFFAAVIFFGSILNGSLIAIAERQREIATFRVLGYPPTQVGEIFLRENMVLNVIGTMVGMPLGFLMFAGMITGFTNDAYAFPAYVATSTWFWTIGLGIFFVLAAYAVVYRSILKLNWAEALSMKE